jgi:hypothetical protein
MLITPPETVAPPKRANGLSCLFYHNTFTKWQTYYRSGPTRRMEEHWNIDTLFSILPSAAVRAITYNI